MYTPVYRVVEIISGFTPDPAPQLGGGHLTPHVVLQRGHATPVAPVATAPASKRQLVRAGVKETRRGAEEAVKEMTDSSGEGCRIHILSKKKTNKQKKHVMKVTQSY